MTRLFPTLFVLLSLLDCAATADTLYRDPDNMPMTGMMLDMMDAFGMVEKMGEYDQSGVLPGLAAPVPLSPGSNLLNDPALLKKWQQSQTLSPFGAAAPWLQPVIPADSQQLDPSKSRSRFDAVPGFFDAEKDGTDPLVEAEQFARQHGTGKAVSGAVDTSLLDGIWRSQHGEVLAISRGRFIWRDTQKRQLSGYLKVVGTLMLATIPGQDRPVEFFYAISGNYLNVYDSNSGRTFSFYRSRK